MASRTPATRSVFIDSSVFFAAAYSPNGSAFELFHAAIRGRIGLVLSRYVLDETERNLAESAPHVLPAFARFCAVLPFRLSTPSTPLVLDTARIVVAKDAPIVAAARSARVRLVATYDRRDLLSKREEILTTFGITVATPEEILLVLGLR